MFETPCAKRAYIDLVKVMNDATDLGILDPHLDGLGGLFVFSKAISQNIREWADVEGERKSGRMPDVIYLKRIKKLRKTCEECKSALEFCAHQLLDHPKSWTNAAMEVAENFFDELLDDALNLLDLPDARDRGRFIMKKLRKYRPDVFLH